MPHSGDLVHECNSGNKTLDEEDIPITGNWIDYSGSGNVSPSVLSTLGLANHSQGTYAGIQGHKEYEVTARGNRKSTHRQRKKLIHFNFNGGV